MNLKPLIIILLLLLPTATASVTREFTWNSEKHTGSFTIPESSNRTVIVTLTPSPYSDYDIPGYFITESLPSDITFYGTNAEWSDLSDRTLSILKFMPASDKSTITYTVRLDKEKKYDFFGTYKDENKIAGEIPTQTITVESKPLINFSNIWEPKKEKELPIIALSDSPSGDIIPINALQESSGDMTTPFIMVLLLINIALGYFVYKKHYAKKPEPEKPVPVIHEPPKETFEIIGDDDDETFGIIDDNDSKVEDLKSERRILLDRLNYTEGKYSRNIIYEKIFALDKEIEECQNQ